MRSPVPPLPITDEQRSVLEKFLRSQTAPHRDVQRARVLVMAGDGIANTQIAGDVGVSAATVMNWRERFAQDGLKNFSTVRPGRGRKPPIPVEQVEEIVRLTLTEKPAGATHWSCRSMAHTDNPQPFQWTARAEQMLEKVRRGRVALEAIVN